MKRIGILGAGTWGMALARMLTVSGNDVLVWSAIEKEIDDLSTTRVHPNLPQMKIPEELRFTKSIEEVCKDKDILLFAVPSVFVRSTAAKAPPPVADGGEGMLDGLLARWPAIDRAIIASTGGRTAPLARMLRVRAVKCLEFTPATPVPIRNGYDTPETLGAHRLPPIRPNPPC